MAKMFILFEWRLGVVALWLEAVEADFKRAARGAAGKAALSVGGAARCKQRPRLEKHHPGFSKCDAEKGI